MAVRPRGSSGRSQPPAETLARFGRRAWSPGEPPAGPSLARQRPYAQERFQAPEPDLEPRDSLEFGDCGLVIACCEPLLVPPLVSGELPVGRRTRPRLPVDSPRPTCRRRRRHRVPRAADPRRLASAPAGGLADPISPHLSRRPSFSREEEGLFAVPLRDAHEHGSWLFGTAAARLPHERGGSGRTAGADAREACDQPLLHGARRVPRCAHRHRRRARAEAPGAPGDPCSGVAPP
jgi:hypothetical protein